MSIRSATPAVRSRADQPPGRAVPQSPGALAPLQSTTYAAPALEKGLDVLELLAAAAGGLTQNQIAAQLGRSISELFRMLDVLERRGYLIRGPADGAYRLTLKLFELAHRQPQLKRLVAVALPLMQELARTTRQSNHLVVHHDGRILVVAQVESPEAMGFSVRLGTHFPFLADRVSVRTLTAFQTPSRRAELIGEMIENDPRPPSRAALVRRIEAIRRRGHEEHRSDTLPGITDLCFPICDQTGMAVATLTQPYLAQRDVACTVAQAREAQRAIAAQISLGLGAVQA